MNRNIDVTETLTNVARGSTAYFDVIAVLCLAVVPDIAQSLFLVSGRVQTEAMPFVFMLASITTRSLQVAVPVLLIMQLRNIDWKDHGFAPLRPIKDPAIAFGLAIISYVAYFCLAAVLLRLGFNFTGDADGFQEMVGEVSPTFFTVVMIIVASFANGFTEELVMRAYLIPRLATLFGSSVVAVVVTSCLFASYHLYQGRYGVLSALVIGLIFGMYFVVGRRFWPIATAHFFMDAIPLAGYLSPAA